MRRVVVIGSSGSGKTTVARRIAELLGLPHLELDSVRHRDGWDSVDETQFTRVVAGLVAGDAWVVDGNYTSLGTRETVWPRADTVVWLDLPRWLVTMRVIRRTWCRALTRERLWGSVTEPWANFYSLDPLRNIVVWTWTRHRHTRRKYLEAMSDGSWAHATVHRLRSRGEVRRFLDSLEADPQPPH